MLYKTKQRDEILRFFMDHEDECFTAKEVCAGVQAGDATVFRNIASLTEEGKLKRFTGSRGESAYYQFNVCGDCNEHIHLKCEKCGQLIHMDCSFMKEILAHFRSEHGFSVDCGRTVIYGLCEACSGGSDSSDSSDGSDSKSDEKTDEPEENGAAGEKENGHA